MSITRDKETEIAVSCETDEDLVLSRLANGTLTVTILAEVCNEGCEQRVRYDVLNETAACGCTVEGPESCNIATRPMVVGRLREALALVLSKDGVLS